MKYELSEKEIAAIQEALNASGKTGAYVQAQDGKIIVLQIDRKKKN